MKPVIRSLMLALLVMVQNNLSLAQKTSAERSALLEPVVFKNNQIKWSPIRIVDPINPGVELGYERLYGKNWSTQLSLGYMKDVMHLTTFINYRGNRSSIEQKYFVDRKKRKATYLAFEFVRLKANYGYTSSFGYDTTLNKSPYLDRYDVTYSDSYDIDKQTLAFNAKYGLQIPLKNFILDITAGIGVKHRKVTRTGVDNPKDGEVKSRHPNIYEMANKEGDHWGVSVPINFKIGYQF